MQDHLGSTYFHLHSEVSTYFRRTVKSLDSGELSILQHYPDVKVRPSLATTRGGLYQGLDKIINTLSATL